LGTSRNQDRKSWVVWQEGGKYPNVIVEILSESTAKIDREEKKQIYQDVFRIPDYFWFDPESLEFQGFTLLRGTYEPIEASEQGWLWSQQLGLYLGIHQRQLRYFTTDGELVPTPEEAAQQEKQRAEQERQRAEQEKQRAEQLEEKLRRLGIDPDEL
jgi:hypothetical protein